MRLIASGQSATLFSREPLKRLDVCGSVRNAVPVRNHVFAQRVQQFGRIDRLGEVQVEPAPGRALPGPLVPQRGERDQEWPLTSGRGTRRSESVARQDRGRGPLGGPSGEGRGPEAEGQERRVVGALLFAPAPSGAGIFRFTSRSANANVTEIVMQVSRGAGLHNRSSVATEKVATETAASRVGLLADLGLHLARVDHRQNTGFPVVGNHNHLGYGCPLLVLELQNCRRSKPRVARGRTCKLVASHTVRRWGQHRPNRPAAGRST